jgi:hypothetical protein
VAEADNDARREARRRRSRPIAEALHYWMRQQRQKIPDGSATARGIDYSLNRWVALTRFIDDGALPIDNNWVENQIRPIALGRSNWLFAGSLRAGKRAAAVMSLIHSARINGLDPYAYIRDVLERLPLQPHPSSRWVRRTHTSRLRQAQAERWWCAKVSTLHSVHPELVEGPYCTGLSPSTGSGRTVVVCEGLHTPLRSP